MEWDWAFVVEILPTLVEGVKITILATLLGSIDEGPASSIRLIFFSAPSCAPPLIRPVSETEAQFFIAASEARRILITSGLPPFLPANG